MCKSGHRILGGQALAAAVGDDQNAIVREIGMGLEWLCSEGEGDKEHSRQAQQCIEPSFKIIAHRLFRSFHRLGIVREYTKSADSSKPSADVIFYIIMRISEIKKDMITYVSLDTLSFTMIPMFFKKSLHFQGFVLMAKSLASRWYCIDDR